MTLKAWLQKLFPNLLAAASRWSADDASSMAASVAYYLALSLFPMVLLLTSALGVFLHFTHLGQDARAEIIEAVSKYGSPVISKQFEQVLGQMGEHAVITGPFGVFTAIMAAIGVFTQLDRGFDRIWRTGSRRDTSLWLSAKRIIKERLAAFVTLLGLGGMVVTLFIGEMALSHFRSIAGKQMPSLSHVFGAMDLAFTTLANAFLFCLLYRWLPNKKVGWIKAFRGGLLAAVVWELGRIGLGAFLIGMRYTSAYGAIGSFIALLLWCYYGVSIIYFGAEYVQILQAQADEANQLEGNSGHAPHANWDQPIPVVATSESEAAQPMASAPTILSFEKAVQERQIARQRTTTHRAEHEPGAKPIAGAIHVGLQHDRRSSSNALPEKLGVKKVSPRRRAA